MTSDIKKAGQIVESYAEDLKGLEVSECMKSDFSFNQCKVLAGVLGLGAKGEITADERTQLEKANFSKEFIEKIAGTDGRAALERRAEWLADHMVYSRWRSIYGGNCDDWERRKMISELSYMKYAGAVLALIEVSGYLDWDVRWQATDALGEMKDPRAVPALIETLGDSERSMRYRAANALGKIKDPRAVPALIVAMGDSENFVRLSVADALVKIGGPAVPDLIEAMKSLNPRVRAGVVGVLGRIGAKYGDGIAHVRWAIPDLQRMAEVDPDADCRKKAKEVLEELQKKIP